MLKIYNNRSRLFRARINFLIFAVLLVLSFVLAGCNSEASSEDTSQVTASKELTIDEKVDKIVESMSLPEKVGQMMMIGIHGTDVNDDSIFMLNQYHFGGVILFDRNMESKEQVALLNKHLQENAGKLPLFIAIDEEGGLVARMRDVLIPPPSQLSIGNTGNSDNARQSAYDIALELKQMGFNVNFAPVADIGSFKDRHFSTDPDTAALFVAAAAKGYEEAGIIYSLKHFPGIGKGETVSDRDTHLDSVIVDSTREVLFNEDIVPFQKVISSKDNSKFMIMVSHVIFTNLDEKPSSISSTVMKDILRNELNYQGIVITDDMEMGAIAKYYGYRRAAVEAVKSGADIVLMCHEYEHEQDAYLGLLEAVENNEISMVQIDQHVRRIIKTKLLNLI